MQYRERCGEKLGPNSPIIREQFDRDNLLKVRNPKPVPLRTIRTILYDTLNKAGVTQREHLVEGQRQGKSRKEIPLAHGFRRFFSDEVYYDKGSEKSQAKLLEQFYRSIDALTINEENRLKFKVQELTSKTESNEYIKIKLSEKDDKIHKLEEEMAQVRKMMVKDTPMFFLEFFSYYFLKIFQQIVIIYFPISVGGVILTITKITDITN
jgi:hypothetical protein